MTDRRRILVLPDKFKGTLTADAAARAIAEGWRRARPADVLEELPMADGGDGFGPVFGGLVGASGEAFETIDAAGRRCRASWWWAAGNRTAVVEAARVNGLAMLPPGVYHPFDLDTYGLGPLLGRVAQAGPRRTLVGIGGSATNDGGFGMARALGWRFVDEAGADLIRWTDLDRLAGLRPPARPLDLGELTVAVDVDNPLLGPRGASRVYGPQKGLRADDMAKAEACLGRLAEVVRDHLGEDVAAQPGAGAAGGLGFGLRAFCGGAFRPGIEIFADLADLPARIAAADLVVTGEGAVDAQTAMGKGVGRVAAMAAAAGRPCLVLAGVADSPAAGGLDVHAVVPGLADREAALAEPARWLAALAERVAGAPRTPRRG